MASKYDEIFGSDWARILNPFLKSEEFQGIREELKKLTKQIDPFYPGIDHIFRPFKTCPYGDMITVFLTTNPYDVQNDGLAFSSKSTNLFTDYPKVLDCLFNAVEADYDLYLNRDPDLERWAEQGVLLLNCDLTTVKGKPGAHLKLWHPFMRYLFKFIGMHCTGIIYVLIGKHAHNFEQYVGTGAGDVFKLEHPMIALKENRPWEHEGIFKRINEISTFLNNRSIDWKTSRPAWTK